MNTKQQPATEISNIYFEEAISTLMAHGASVSDLLNAIIHNCEYRATLAYDDYGSFDDLAALHESDSWSKAAWLVSVAEQQL
jgi:hypothetical protein